MAFPVHISPRAVNDIEETLAFFLELGAPQAGQRWHDAVLQKLVDLQDAPEQWPLAPEAADLGIELRQVLDGRWRSVYRVLFVVELAPEDFEP